MSLTMYQASVPVFIRQLGNLSHILKKAAASAEARKIDETVFINARLAPDMFALPRQVQIATDIVKGCGARLAGVDVPAHEDKEASFADLQARIEKTISFLKTLKAEPIDASAEKDIALKVGGKEMTFKGRDYLLNFVNPNMYFHITTAYAILRHNGVDIGKGDYLGNP